MTAFPRLLGTAVCGPLNSPKRRFLLRFNRLLSWSMSSWIPIWPNFSSASMDAILRRLLRHGLFFGNCGFAKIRSSEPFLAPQLLQGRAVEEEAPGGFNVSTVTR